MDTQVVQESLIKVAAHLLSRHFLFMKSDKIKAARYRGHQRDIVANPHYKRNSSAAQPTQTIP